MILTRNVNGYSIIAAENMGEIRKFDLSSKSVSYQLLPLDWKVDFELNGKKWSQEYPYGSGYLSQQTRSIKIPRGINSIEITNYLGEKRTVDISK
jgi:hypothetical protein